MPHFSLVWEKWVFYFRRRNCGYDKPGSRSVPSGTDSGERLEQRQHREQDERRDVA